MTKSVVILASSIGLLILLVVLNTTFYPAARPFSPPVPGLTESFTPIINNNHHISDDSDYHSSQIITHSNPQSSSTEIKDSTEDDLERFFREIERVGENLGDRRLAFNESLRCDIEQDKLQNPPYTVFVTSSNSKFIELRKRSGFSHSLWQNRIPYPLWMYHENTWEIAYGRNPLKKDEIPQSDCFLDVFEAVPNLLEFLQNEGSYVNEFYKIDGVRSLSDSIMDGKALIRKVAAMAHAANQLPLGSHLIWVDVDTEFVSDLDSEYYNFTNGKDIVYIVELICRRHLEGVKTLQDIPLWCYDFKIETGVVSIRVSKNTRNFLNTALKWYNGPMLALARKCLLSATTTEKASRSQFGQGGRGHGGAHNPASSSSTTTSSSSSSFMSSSFCEIPWIRNNIGLNDVFVLNMLLHRYGNSSNLSSPNTMLKQGWFANMEFMCQSSNDDHHDDDDNDDDNDDDDGDDPFSTVQGHCSVCAQRKKKNKEKLQSSDDDDVDNLVSPFYIQKYINHYHDASGIMTLLHNPDYNPPDSKVEQKDKTRDGAMKLPNSWFNQNHVDPRPACDDHNLRNDCFHTMRCGTDRRLKTPMSADAYIPLELY